MKDFPYSLFGIHKEDSDKLIARFNTIKISERDNLLLNEEFKKFSDNERCYLMFTYGICTAMRSEETFINKMTKDFEEIKRLSDSNERVTKVLNLVYLFSIVIFLIMAVHNWKKADEYEHRIKLKAFSNIQLPAYYQYRLKGEVE